MDEDHRKGLDRLGALEAKVAELDGILRKLMQWTGFDLQLIEAVKKLEGVYYYYMVKQVIRISR
jgi:hypothetical protein